MSIIEGIVTILGLLIFAAFVLLPIYWMWRDDE